MCIKHLASLRLERISSTVGVKKCVLLIAQFRSLGSRQSLNLLVLATHTREFTQSIGSVAFVKISCLTNESSERKLQGVQLWERQNLL